MTEQLESLRPIVIYVLGLVVLFAAAHALLVGRSAGRALAVLAVGSLGSLLVMNMDTVAAMFAGSTESTPTDTAPATPTIESAPAGAPAPKQPFDWTPVIWIAVGVVALAVLTKLVLVVAKSVARHRAVRADREADRAAQLERWERGKAALAHTSEAITAFETDPESVFFVRPLLADVTEESTAALYTAYETAQLLDQTVAPHDDTMIDRFVGSAVAAERAFKEADANARRKAADGIGANGIQLDRAQRRRLRIARGALATALDPSVPDDHAILNWKKTIELLDGLVTVPAALSRRLTLAIEAGHRPALTMAANEA